LPGASEPRLTELTRQGFRSAFQAALRSQGNRSIVVVGNYEFGPITVEPCRAKARPLHPRRSYFAPVFRDRRSVIRHQGNRLISGRRSWWRRRVLPPGPNGLLRRPFIAVSGSRRLEQYNDAGGANKGRRRCASCSERHCGAAEKPRAPGSPAGQAELALATPEQAETASRTTRKCGSQGRCAFPWEARGAAQ